MSVKLEDSIESSGAGEATDLIIPGLFETFSSGEGPDTTSDVDANVGILGDIADQELNGTYIPLAPNIGQVNSMNDTKEIDLSDTTTSSGETAGFPRTQEIVVTTTTTRETTVLPDETQGPVTATSTTTTETTTETTTTKAPSTTTTPHVTTSTHTTVRTTTKQQPPRKTIKPAVTTTSTSDYDPLPCSFNEEDLKCTKELFCFGEGEVDCTEPDEEEPFIKPSAVHHSTGAEYEDEYEDSVMLSTEPSDLTIRLPAWKKLSGLKRHQFASTMATTEHYAEEITSKASVADETSEAPAITQNESVTNSTLRPSDTTAVISNIPTSNTENPETEATTSLHTEIPTTHSEDSLSETRSLELYTPNLEKNNTKDSPVSELSSELPDSESSSPGNVEIMESKIKRRRKRQNKHPIPDSSVLSSSEPQKLSSFSVTKDQKDKKLCKIKGNLLCTPAPTMGFCKGSGRCHAVVEKKEKSTGQKGVENWAIAVIAICATAAAVTISLLIYLVVTSWKKLKVQPQNGVTTLTYVNNATP